MRVKDYSFSKRFIAIILILCTLFSTLLGVVRPEKIYADSNDLRKTYIYS